MQLLIEQYDEYEKLYEASEDGDGKKKLYIQGIFMQADTKNRNGRVYPKHILQKEVSRYIKECIDSNSAYGELDHPASTKINSDRISHRIVSLKEDGNNYIGKALILGTPMGNIVREILEGGGHLGVSSRGIGSVKDIGGTLQVQEDFRLATCADIVTKPSVSAAIVDSIYESVLDTNWVYDNVNEMWIAEKLDKKLRKTTSQNINEQEILNNWKLLIDTLSNQ